MHAVIVPTYGVDVGGALTATLCAETTRSLEQLIAARPQAMFAPPTVRVGDPRDVIDAVATELHADLIIMGTHGRRGLSRLVLGSVAEAVVRSAPCSVLTVRGG